MAFIVLGITSCANTGSNDDLIQRIEALEAELALIKSDVDPVTAMGEKSNGNPLHHERYTDTEAVVAMGIKSDNNPLHHDRYSDAEVLGVTDGRYLRSSGGGVNGDLQVNGDLMVGGALSVGTTTLQPWMARVARDGNTVLNFQTPDGTTTTLDLATVNDGAVVANGNNTIAFRNGNAGVDSVLYFNISGAPNMACTLLHNEDDTARTGWHFATDSGNAHNAVWGDGITPTFVLKRTGDDSTVIPEYGSFNILCF